MPPYYEEILEYLAPDGALLYHMLFSYRRVVCCSKGFGLSVDLPPCS